MGRTVTSMSQGLRPLMGAPVDLGTAANGAIVNQAALDAHAKTFPPRRGDRSGRRQHLGDAEPQRGLRAHRRH